MKKNKENKKNKNVKKKNKILYSLVFDMVQSPSSSLAK